MWFKCRVPGCDAKWQAHDTSSAQKFGVCQHHRCKHPHERRRWPVSPHVEPEPVKFFFMAYAIQEDKKGFMTLTEYTNLMYMRSVAAG